MGVTRTCFSSPRKSSSPKIRLGIILGLSFVVSFFIVLFLSNDAFPGAEKMDDIHLQTRYSSSVPQNKQVIKPPRWLEVVNKRPLRVGMLNIEDAGSLKGLVDSTVTINLESVSPDVKWQDLFPQWIHNDSVRGCPSIPMPEPGKYLGLDVVVAELPCNNGGMSKDVGMLQVSLATARLIVDNEAANSKGIKMDVYAVLIGKCEPMAEIFRCDDLVWRQGEYWVYKPDVDSLREFITMPVGTCDLTHPHSHAPGTMQFGTQITEPTANNYKKRARHAYVTVIHSSERYVCGAIVLAQSLGQSNTSKDLVLLVDNSIPSHSISALQAAGWNIVVIDRIRSPYAAPNSYNEWNYSKLRIWQLTQYEKLIFIDSDFLVLRNIDHFFNLPQLSASPDTNQVFNSGIMILEPSNCFFDRLMRKRLEIKSYNGGDQGYLNEVFTWWHRLTTRLNFLKVFNETDTERAIPEDVYAIHFIGLKPWMCYRDYDCNWDNADLHLYASDDAHAMWWRVYDAMSVELQAHCGMTGQLDFEFRRRREMAQEANLFGGHWKKIDVKDPRQFQFMR